MSYAFQPDRIYRTPTHFGPAPGPRQQSGGARYANVDSPRTTWIWADLAVEADELSQHLPPGFEPGPDSQMRIELRYRRDIAWLAGRGYNIVMVSWLCVWAATGQTGWLQAAVWENCPDAIITGRDELGVPKLYATIPDTTWRPDLAQRRVDNAATASWDAHTFLTVDLSDITPVTPHAVTLRRDYFQWRHVPAPGRPGASDASYALHTPTSHDSTRILDAYSARVEVVWWPGTFDQLPTLCHIVDGLAGLRVDGTVQAGIARTIGGRDLGNQLRLDRAGT